MSRVQYIHLDGEPLFAVVPIDLFNDLIGTEKDGRSIEEIRQAVESGEEETFPDDFVGRLIETDYPMREWRLYRGLTQAELAKAAGTSQAAIALIESGKRNPTIETARKFADALGCEIDDLF